MCLIHVILSCVLVTSCQTSSQRQGDAIRQGLQLANQRGDDCFRKIEANPMYQNLYQHLSGNPNLATPAQLADEGMPTEEDVELLISRHNEIALCRGQFIEDHMQVAPSVVPIITEYYYGCDLVVADLLQRQTSWGEANKRLRGLNLKVNSQLRQAFTDMDQRLAASHQSEMAQRQAAFDSLQRWNAQQLAQQQEALRQQQQNLNQAVQNTILMNTLNRPVTTHCTRIGNQVHCTSQ